MTKTRSSGGPVRLIGLFSAAIALALPAAAGAHVSVEPNTVPAGAFATLTLRVPGEQSGAHVTKVDTLLPAGFTSVTYANVPGWTVQVRERKLAQPVQTDDGPVDTEVSEIVWSWSGAAGDSVEDGRFALLPLSVAIPDADAGKPLEFKTVESYSNGHVDRWIDSALESETPAPRINVTARGGAIENVAGDEAGPSAAQARADVAPTTPAATTSASSGASKGLGIAALVLGALGFAIGCVALAATRRRGS
jgi:periplasmic copper chaperone A